jgi:transposase-like protein
MGKQHKTWTPEQKRILILAALRDEHRVAALARQHRGSGRQMSRWKAQLLEGGRQALGGVKTPRADQRLQAIACMDGFPGVSSDRMA